MIEICYGTASQLPGRGPTDVDDAPTPLNQNSDYDDDDDFAYGESQRH